MDEASLQNHIRLAISQQAQGVVWRNNVGACKDQSGRMIRYGLCNDSKQLNEEIKSSDLIGITPIVIMPHHVGRRIGVFTAIEVKDPQLKLSYVDKRVKAQQKYIDIVRNLGGFAGFAQSVDDIWGILS